MNSVDRATWLVLIQQEVLQYTWEAWLADVPLSWIRA